MANRWVCAISRTVIERDRTFPERTIKARPYPFICSTRGPCHSWPKIPQTRVPLIFFSLSLSRCYRVSNILLPKIFESKNIKRSFLRLSVGEKCFSPSEKRRIFGETRLSRKMEKQEAVKKCVRKVWYNIMRSGSIA